MLQDLLIAATRHPVVLQDLPVAATGHLVVSYKMLKKIIFDA